jgi:hypothetical protein
MKGPNIKLHIEELVLHGFAPNDRYAIADAVESELSHLLATQFAERGAQSSLAHNAEHARLDAGSFHVTLGDKSSAIGAQIAQAVHGRVTK